ncbi:hypothetical protein ACFQT0_19510 [Hymenobacter humi]|uniref:Uncharacterized protein n=1 Tax=Hymenobacter humi TaxID=1411620 RepID=A0ABW2U911_9BACT
MAAKVELTPEQKIEQLEKQLAAITAESEAKDAIIEGQTEQLAAAEIQGAGSLPVLTHDKKRYQVLAGQFTVEGKLVKAEDLKTDKSLVESLLKSGSGILVLLEEKTEAKA